MIIREAKTNKKTKVAVKKSNKSKNEATTSAMVSTPQGGFRDKEDGFIVIKCPNCDSEYINIHDDGDMFYCSTCGNLWPVDSYKGETGKAVKEAVKREMRKRRRIHNKDIAFPTYDEAVEYCLDNKIELSNITQDADTDDYIVCIENPIKESYNFINEAVNKKTWSKVNSSLTAYIGMDKSDIKNLKSFFDYIYDYVEDVCGGFYEGKVNYDERPEFVTYSWSIQGKKPFKRFDVNNVVKRIKSRLSDFKVVDSGTYKVDGREWPFRLVYEPKDSEYMHDITIGLDFMTEYDESGKDDKYKINANSDGPLVDFLIVLNKDENVQLNKAVILDII